MNLKELQTIDAEELASQPLPPPSFIVDGLIPYGLCVLAGPSKCGKSWLMLWLCMRVSQGLPIWERKTQQCDVLYLCLEDTYARIQRRMYRLNEESVPELRLGVISEKLHCGLEEQIEQHLNKFPNTKLVVIDTLQKVRKPNSADSNMYAADYEDISALKRIADQRSIAIVLVHHLRKLKDNSDPFNELSGSTGLMGALDTCLLMKRTNRAEETAKLLVTGRDIEDQDLVLRFNDCVWDYIGEVDVQEAQQEEAYPPFLHHLVSFMENQTEWVGNATELLSALSETEVTPKGVVRCIRRYYYEFLEPRGIRFRTRRTPQSRLIILWHDKQHDANDDHDDGISAEKPSSFSS